MLENYLQILLAVLMIYLIVTNNSNNELPVLHRSEYPGKTNHVEYDYDEYT